MLIGPECRAVDLGDEIVGQQQDAHVRQTTPWESPARGKKPDKWRSNEVTWRTFLPGPWPIGNTSAIGLTRERITCCPVRVALLVSGQRVMGVQKLGPEF